MFLTFSDVWHSSQLTRGQFQQTLTPGTDVKVKAKLAAEMFKEFRNTSTIKAKELHKESLKLLPQSSHYARAKHGI